MTPPAGPAPARDAPRARRAVAGLAAAVLSVRPLVAGMDAPVRVPAAGRVPPSPGQWGVLEALLDRVARRAGVPGLVLSRDTAPGVFERVVGDRLALADVAAELGALDGRGPPAAVVVDRIVADTVAGSFDAVFGKERVRSADGVPLEVYGGGPAGGEAVVLVPACGMPAALAEPWMRHLARDLRVLTWESRGLFGGPGDGADGNGADGDRAVDTAAQAADLVAVLDHHGVARAHVVGLCGGAVIALAAAAARPERVASLSLWHGAYAFAGGSPRTRFQNDLIELMTLAAGSRAAARSVHAAFAHVALADAPADLAHLVLHPFVNAERLYRYCRLNGTLARTEVDGYLPRVHQPVLVVTSESDRTAHPQGSRRVADGVAHGSLHLDDHGDHAALFGDRASMEVAVEFIGRAGRCRPNRGQVHRAGVGDRGIRDEPDRDAPEERG